MVTVYYSQKTGAYSGDTSVWNTASGGGGSAGDPTQDDLRVVQSGHTISSGSSHVASAMVIEAGGAWNKGAYMVQLKGSLINFAGSSGIVSTGGKISIIKSCKLFGIPENFLNDTVIEEGVSVRVLNGSQVKLTRPLQIEGNLDAIDAALSFAGTGRVEIPHDDSLDVSMQDFSFMAIVTWDSATPSYGSIVRKGSSSKGWSLFHDGTNLVFRVWDDVPTVYEASVAFTPVPDRIYHILCRREAMNIYLYVDWVLMDDNPEGGNDISVSDPLVIGNWDNGVGFAYPHEGKILDVRFWMTPRTLTDLVDNLCYNVNPTGSMRFRLQFDEGFGASVYDDTGYHNDGTRMGSEAGWVQPSDLISEHEVHIGPGSATNLPSGIADRIVYHGTLTIPPAYIFEYRDSIGAFGTLSGSLLHSSYHSTALALALTDADFPGMQISSLELARGKSRSSKLDVSLIDTPTVQNYLLGQDTIQISRDSNVLFKGTLWRRAPKGSDTAQLTFYDYLFNLKKTKVYRQILGNLHQWKIATVTKASPATISMTGLYSSTWSKPFVDITFLETVAKQLRVNTSYYADVGYDGGPPGASLYGARYFELREDAGDILRIALCLGDLDVASSGTKGIYYKLLDMDPDSPNYDTAIVTGTILETEIPTGTGNYLWIVKDIIDLFGRVKAPKRVKICIGNVTDTGNGTIRAKWYGTEVAQFEEISAGKTSQDSCSEGDLIWKQITVNQGEGDQSAGIGLAAELECMGDWCDKRDPADIDYQSTSVIALRSWADRPSFDNITRKASSSTWNIARITVWHDPEDVDYFLARLWSDYGRWWFDRGSVNVSSALVPYLIFEKTSPLDVMVSILDRYRGELYPSYSGTQVQMNCVLSKVESGWASYTDAQKRSRMAVWSGDLSRYPALYKHYLERFVRGELEKNLEEKAYQIIIENNTGEIPILSDYDTAEPFYPQIESYQGDIDQALDDALARVDELNVEAYGQKVELVDAPSDLLLHTNELLKVTDSRHGWSRIGKVNEARIKWDGKGWSQSLDLVDPVGLPPATIRIKDIIRGNYQLMPGNSPGFDRAKGAPPLGGGVVIPTAQLEPDKAVEIAVEVHMEYTNSSGTWWILLGGTYGPAETTPTAMQETDESKQVIAAARRIEAGGHVYLYAAITEAHLLGEFKDCFLVKEIGVINDANKPDFTDTVNARVELFAPDPGVNGFVADMITAPQVYRPPFYFLRNGIHHITFGT
jgi:hypothetical protein